MPGVVLEGLLTGPELLIFAVKCSELIAALESGNQEHIAD